MKKDKEWRPSYKPLNENQAKALMGLIMYNEIDLKKFEKDAKENDDFFPLILIKRIKVLNLPRFEPSAILFLSMLVDRPGTLILGLYDTLNKYTELNTKEKIDASFIAQNVYPFGFYDDKSVEEAYYKKKSETNNEWHKVW